MPDGVTGTAEAQHLGQARSIESLAGHDVVEHPDRAGFLGQPAPLYLEVLVAGGDAGITKHVRHRVPPVPNPLGLWTSVPALAKSGADRL